MRLNKLCRLCAKEHASLIDVYGEEGVRLNLLSKLVQCLHIWVTPEDKLPTTICAGCCLRLGDSAEFITDSLQAQGVLQGLLGEEAPDEKPLVEVKRDEDCSGSESEEEDESGRADEEGGPGQEETAVEEDLPGPPAEGAAPPRSLVECILQDAPAEERDGRSEQRGQEEVTEAGPARRARREVPRGAEAPGRKKLRPKLESWYETWQCSECPAVLGSSDQLRAHYGADHPGHVVRYQCVDCSRVYPDCRKLARHIRVHWNKGKFKCEQCPKTFSTRQNLAHHAILHEEDRPWACGLCDKRFRHASSLNFHRVAHLGTGESKFSCADCGRNFLSSQKLELHLKIHAGTREHTCHLCGKSFTVKQSLIAHMTTHDEGRPHVCAQCGAGFKTPYSLRHHALIHSGVKPHQCDVCGKQFRGKSALRQHNRIHTGAMPYDCDICGRKFRFQGVFVIHRRQHTGERPYKCAHCTREFVSWANYNKHMKCRHGGGKPLPAAPPPGYHFTALPSAVPYASQ
ncbi:zinc finger protein 696-like isoform X2 [Bacillus rossius redtenbacheri]|uniref:zinc finger protein 696-like isoform X2 n=1 Tax=Bacillus rossius redtenbacheri TaxID=93214 RepID=UPI002FDDBBF9